MLTEAWLSSLLTELACKSYISEAPYRNWSQGQRTVSSSPSNDLWILYFLCAFQALELYVPEPRASSHPHKASPHWGMFQFAENSCTRGQERSTQGPAPAEAARESQDNYRENMSSNAFFMNNKLLSGLGRWLRR